MGEFDDLLPEFLQEAEDIFENLYQHLGGLTPGPFPTEVMDAINRGVHTLKGGAGLFGFEKCKEKCHKLEDKVNELKKNNSDLTAEFISFLKREISEIQEGLKVTKPTDEPKSDEAPTA